MLAPAGVRAAVSPTWQLPVLERVIRLCTLGSGVTLTTWHHIAGKREAETRSGGLATESSATTAQERSV